MESSSVNKCELNRAYFRYLLLEFEDVCDIFIDHRRVIGQRRR